MINPLDFTGKVALVTGAAAGMGLATAQAFAEAGAAVVLPDVSEDAVRARAAVLVRAGHKALAICCEVSDDGARDVVSGDEHAYADLAKTVPMGRAGRPEEIASARSWRPHRRNDGKRVSHVPLLACVAPRRPTCWPILQAGETPTGVPVR